MPRLEVDTQQLGAAGGRAGNLAAHLGALRGGCAAAASGAASAGAPAGRGAGEGAWEGLGPAHPRRGRDGAGLSVPGGDSYAGIAVPEGEPESLRDLAATFTGLAGGLQDAAGVFRGLPSEMPGWLGVASVAFAGATGMGDGGARSAASTLGINARTVRAYADALEAAQRKAEQAIDLARDAIRRIELAEQRIADARERRLAAELAISDAASSMDGMMSGVSASAIERAQAEVDRADDDERRARMMLEDARDDLEQARRRGREADDEADVAASQAAGVLGGGPPGGGLPFGLGSPATGGVRGGGAGPAPLAALMFGLPFGGQEGGAGEDAFGGLAPFLGVFAAMPGVFGVSGDRDREDRRIENDDRLRIPPGGRTDRSRGAGGDFESDWAGRALLENYLTGGDDLTIENDADWNEYMRANPALTSQLDVLVQRKAVEAYDDYHQDNVAFQTFSDTTSMEIQNGESISGYQYLHGTNADIGGFEHTGSAKVTPVQGGYEVELPGEFTWNDRIDPNGQYRSDQVKSTAAEILTLSRADGYDLHLTWPAETTVRLDEAGNVISVEGYPGE